MSDVPHRTAEDEPPWERLGAFGLDCEPHRGELLSVLGRLRVVAGTAAATGFLCVPLSAMVALLAVALGLTAGGLARRDLRRMEAGGIDPRGHGLTAQGEDLGRLGVFLGLIGLLASAAFVT